MKTIALFAAGAALVGAAGCTDHLAGVTGPQSLKVELVAPTDIGAPDRRLDTTLQNRTVTVVVTALGPDKETVTDFNFEVGVRTQSLGVVTPPIIDQNIQQIMLTNGVSDPTDITLPAEVFGPTVVWIEDGGDGGTYATGTSPTIWYRDPFIHDIQQADETSLNPLLSSPLEDHQIAVGGSRYNLPSVCPTMDCGKLIVTSIYAQGYTVSDVDCGPGGTPPCTTGDYDSVLVFSFQRPVDENRCDLAVGELIDGFAGAVQEFTGQTEIGFPQTFVAATNDSCGNRVVDAASLPEPFHIDPTWFDDLVLFERAEGALVSVDTATLGAGFPVACPLDSEYETYKQWELDIGDGCGKPISAITSGTVATWAPEDHVGMTLSKVVGAFRPVNFNTGGGVWVVYPRSESDLVP